MDLIVYVIVLAILGAVRVRGTVNVSDSVGIVDTGTTTLVNDLPIGDNLMMYKEPNAYTFILYELGLKKW